MSDFEEKNAEEKTEVAEEGWTAVKGKGTTRRTEEEQNEMKAKAAKKRKKGQLVSILEIKFTILSFKRGYHIPGYVIPTVIPTVQFVQRPSMTPSF